MRTRPGISLIEVIVALVVFSIGALGSAAGLGAAARAMAVAAARREDVAAIRHRVALLAATPCGSLAGGRASDAGVELEWSVSVSDSVVRASVRATRGGASTLLNAEFACK